MPNPNMNQVNEWKKYANDLKRKRTKGNVKLEPKAKGPKTDSITASREIIVQPLATEATGKATKNERTGPQVFVTYLYDEVTISNVIKSRNEHFKDSLKKDMTCDVLAGERGPSCNRIDQLPGFKPIHVRFVRKKVTSEKYRTISDFCGIANRPSAASSCSAAMITTNDSMVKPTLAASVKLGAGERSNFKKPFPKSLPVTAMMKLGKAIYTISTPSISIDI
eukprot:gene21333-23408_t